MPIEEKTFRDPRPGDFVPPDRSKRAPRKDAEEGEEAPAPKTALPVSDIEEQATQRAKLYEDMVKDLSPVEDYQEYLKAQKIPEEVAGAIVDNLFTRGYHSERYKLTKRIAATLRTREHGDTLRLQSALEVQRPIYTHVMNELMARYNLAASLESFGETTFAFAKVGADKDEVERLFDVRLQFIERMPDPAFYRLSDLLAKFDRTVAAVMREGVAENF